MRPTQGETEPAVGTRSASQAKTRHTPQPTKQQLSPITLNSFGGERCVVRLLGHLELHVDRLDGLPLHLQAYALLLVQLPRRRLVRLPVPSPAATAQEGPARVRRRAGRNGIHSLPGQLLLLLERGVAIGVVACAAAACAGEGRGRGRARRGDLLRFGCLEVLLQMRWSEIDPQFPAIKVHRFRGQMDPRIRRLLRTSVVKDGQGERTLFASLLGFGLEEWKLPAPPRPTLT